MKKIVCEREKRKRNIQTNKQTNKQIKKEKN